MAESRQLTRRRFLILTGIGGGASLLVACQAAAPAAPTGAPAATAPAAAKPTEAAKPGAAAPAAAPAGAGQPLRVVLGAEATAIEPALDPVKSSIVIDNTMLDTLAMNTPDLKFVPWLAESWESVAPTRWRLKLKQGVKFHNGEPFNADSVVYSTQVFLTTKGIARSWFDHLSGAEKVDENTVDLITKAPSSILPSSLAFLYVFPPKYHAEQGQAGFGKQPVGTGAWKFVEWNPGVSLKVTPNPDYWGKKPAIGDIQFRWAADGSARVSLIQTGEVDLAQNIPPALTDRVEQSGAARIEQAKSIRKVFLEFNINEGPTADPRVRKALNHAIDVDSVIKTLFRGRAYGRDKGIIHEGFEGYQGDKLQAYTYDLDLAKKLLAEAGYPDGFEMPFWHPIGRYMLDKESSEAMAGQLAKVGVKANLQGMESGAYFNKLTAERVPGANFFSCGPLMFNPTFCAVVHYQSASGYGYGANERTEQYIKDVQGELDAAKRVQKMQEFENYVFNDHVPWVWLWHQQDIYGASNRINWKARPDELMTFEEASFK